jgi:hypothetical protein
MCLCAELKTSLMLEFPREGGNDGKNVVLFPPIQHSFKSVVLEGTVAFYAQGSNGLRMATEMATKRSLKPPTDLEYSYLSLSRISI